MRKNELQGVVMRKSGVKTVAVAVSRVVRHPKYGKRIKRTTTYLAHDEKETADIGSSVIIQESRPLSSRKRWRIVDKSGKK